MSDVPKIAWVIICAMLFSKVFNIRKGAMGFIKSSIAWAIVFLIVMFVLIPLFFPEWGW